MRIFLACDDERLKTAILLLVDNQPGMTVSGITDRLGNLVKQIETSQPDVLILGWKLSLVALGNLMTEIHELADAPEVIYLSRRQEERAAYIAAGLDYFVVANTPPDELLLILTDLRRSKKNKQPTA